jgi:hypothetical protein
MDAMSVVRGTKCLPFLFGKKETLDKMSTVAYHGSAYGSAPHLEAAEKATGACS